MEKLAAIREHAEQLQALRGNKVRRPEGEEAQPIQLRPSVCLRLGQAFLLSAASPLYHSAAHFNLSEHPAWSFIQHKLMGTSEDTTDYKRQSLHAKFAHVAEVIGDAGVYGHRS